MRLMTHQRANLERVCLFLMKPGKEYTVEDMRNRLKTYAAADYSEDAIRAALKELQEKGRVLSAQLRHERKVRVYRRAGV